MKTVSKHLFKFMSEEDFLKLIKHTKRVIIN